MTWAAREVGRGALLCIFIHFRPTGCDVEGLKSGVGLNRGGGSAALRPTGFHTPLERELGAHLPFIACMWLDH